MTACESALPAARSETSFMTAPIRALVVAPVSEIVFMVNQ